MEIEEKTTLGEIKNALEFRDFIKQTFNLSRREIIQLFQSVKVQMNNGEWIRLYYGSYDVIVSPSDGILIKIDMGVHCSHPDQFEDTYRVASSSYHKWQKVDKRVKILD